MALPPTGLTRLLEGTPEQMLDALDGHGCLDAAGPADRQAVLGLIRRALQEHEAFCAQHPGWCGPTGVDDVAKALLASPYLSGRGRLLYHTDERDGTDAGDHGDLTAPSRGRRVVSRIQALFSARRR